MMNTADSAERALQDFREIEESSFYKNYQDFSKMYDSLIQEGITKRRESRLKTIQDTAIVSPLSYNTAAPLKQTGKPPFENIPLDKLVPAWYN
jgi:hypothetical protein